MTAAKAGDTMNEKQESYLSGRLQLNDQAESDARSRLYLMPKRVIWETNEPTGAVQNSAALLAQKSAQISLHSDSLCAFHTGKTTASILLDFGRELHGGIEFSVQQIEGAQRAQLRIRFGESASEAMSELGGQTHATNDHAIRDCTMWVQELSMNPIGETGFRFVRIDLLTPETTVFFKTVKAILLFRDIPYLGSFRCSDPLLNQIWDVGAYTVHLNMQQYIWDGIKRDRLVWIGDLHPEIATIQTVFGDQEIIRDSLDFVVADTPDGAWMNDIPSYSMWWIIIQHDYFMQFGNLAYLKQQLPYLKQLCRMLSAQIGSDGQDTTPQMRFVDWPTKDNKDAVDTGLQALHVLAMQCAAHLFQLCGEAEAAAQCQKANEALRKWPVHLVQAKQANALAVWAGLLDAKEANEKSLAVGGSEGLSAFMAYYILQARAQAGDVSGAMDTLREYWGGMLRLGATTFWEDFDVQWLTHAAPIDRLPLPGEIDVHGSYGSHCYRGFRHSLCHGWSSGVTSWLTRYILGIEILEPGCRKIRIRPNLCSLQWVRGSYPTPLGVLTAEHQAREDGTVQTTIHAPDGIEVFTS